MNKILLERKDSKNNIPNSARHKKRRRANWKIRLSIIFFSLIAISMFALFLGPTWIPNVEMIYIIRFPRILLGILVGAGLATAGCIFQGLLRNPLADPFILGTSSGGALGATLAIVTGISIYSLTISIYVFSILFSFLSIILVYNIARIDGRAPVQTLLLSGVIINTFLSAIVLLLMALFHRESHHILFFLMGSLTGANMGIIKISSIFIIAGLIIGIVFSRDLNLIVQGEETAQHLGVDVERVKMILFFSTSLIVGSVVAVAGMVGFVGLILPHIMRMIVGPDHRILIPASFLAGAIFLLIADAIARTVAAPMEIPVGVITAMCGAPFFIYLLRKKKRIGL